jgi:hypothetical protein
MESLRSSPESLGTKIGEPPVIGQETLGIFQDRSAGSRYFIIFREGPALVRVTLVGEAPAGDLVFFAQKAWEKAR